MASGSVSNVWQFNQKAADSNNVYKIGQRYYDAVTGRWTQQDPASLALNPSQENRYTYAGDDPTTVTDPTGLCGLSGWGDFGSCFSAAGSWASDHWAEIAAGAASCVSALDYGAWVGATAAPFMGPLAPAGPILGAAGACVFAGVSAATGVDWGQYGVA